MSFPKSHLVKLPPELRIAGELFAHKTGPGNPNELNVVPDHIGQEYHDTADEHFYRAVALDGEIRWKRTTSDNP